MSRVAVVTGGTRGIGSEISKKLKHEGYKVAATYAGNDEAAAKFRNETGIEVFKFDVGDLSACEKGVAEITASLGAPEIVVQSSKPI